MTRKEYAAAVFDWLVTIPNLDFAREQRLTFAETSEQECFMVTAMNQDGEECGHKLFHVDKLAENVTTEQGDESNG